MQDYRVELDSYSGPLDLLLYLVRRHEIDLHDIPIAQLTEQYIQHIKLMQQIDVEMAGEFLVMAATLLEIKSATLLPKPTIDPDEPEEAENPLDPRYELVQQLLAYKRFKDAAASLEDRRRLWEQHYPYQPVRSIFLQPDADPDADEPQAIEIDLEDVSVMDLCEAYTRVLESVGKQPAFHEIVYDDTPIALHAEDIVDRLTREGAMSLQKMFVGRESRSEKIGLFLAVLELVRQSKITFHQDDNNQIRLEIRPTEDTPEDTPPDSDAPPRWRDPETGKVQYDWPDEETRLRAERRAHLRAARAEGKEEESEGLEDDEQDTVGQNTINDN